ncbi:type I restriction endonuclease [Geitlerinema sp. CS-897]|nr:type I restriction endonuclease [Geitlerinema sp. CS-897]
MHTETHFEQSIERTFLENGYHKGDRETYDRDRALFPRDVLEFVRQTQPKTWKRLSQLHGSQAETVLLDDLVKHLKTHGMLSVLRQGFKCQGKTVRLAYFAPNTQKNPEAIERYPKNRLAIVRQVKTASGAIPDIVLTVNGLPVVSMELKNPMTNQTAEDAIDQYRSDRDPNELLFRFQHRCLVHFAVDPDRVFMTTKLDGRNTRFLPFNRGYHHGAGNPPIENDHRTAYLWREVLTPDSLLDILGRFLHLETTEKTVLTANGLQRQPKESLIFPRYHQLDAVRRLVRHAQTHGSGHNYLIQHSAGSGKSNSIAWLAHRLSCLHDTQDEKLFHSVIVITDRIVLDRQLQETIYQFDHKQGVVQKIDENTQQLAKALADGVPVIISTIQKFPYISQAIRTLEKKGQTAQISTAGKRFAVIIDEAHSSQSGETAMELRKILNKDGIEAAIAEQLLDLDEEDLSDNAREELLRQQLKRTRQPNLSYFAFTATPKYKTLAAFDEPGEDGTSPFHRYSMRQAIEEGFILDVLQHYTHYQRYYRLVQIAQSDRDLPRRQANRALTRFVDLHEHNIAQKVEVILGHFRTHTRHKLNGKAKAMVVTGSREQVVRYKLAFDKALGDSSDGEIKTLVAFSGEVRLTDYPDRKFTEVSMNGGIKEAELPQKFDTDEYRILLVADKYQTGFDQPLLHTMYVDKRLAGIQAVQTLSRLNRVAPGKTETFVLDFVNDPEEIYKAFKPYYEVTPKGEDIDPNRLDELAGELEDFRVFDRADLDEWCNIWFSHRLQRSGREHPQLNSILDRVVDRFQALEESDREQFRRKLSSFRNLYLFLSQVIPYQDSELEKLYTFGRFLLLKLPRDRSRSVPNLDDEVALKYYRLEQIGQGAIDLKDGDTDALKGPTETGTRQKDENVALSSLVERLNEQFGTDFTEDDQLFFDRVRETALADANIRQAAQANTLENFAPVFKQQLENWLVDRMDENETLFFKLMNDEALRNVVAQVLTTQVYQKLDRESG